MPSYVAARRRMIADLTAEVAEEGYTFVSLRDRELRVRDGDVILIYAQRRMGEGTNNDFTRTWPPGFEFCGSERA